MKGTGVIDFHTHAFPNSLAERAITVLEAEAPGVKAFLDGRVSSLLSSMDRAGIEKSVVCSIATKPSQYPAILSWSKEISSERIIPFPSFHPDDPDYRERIREIKGEGFKGIKFHPFYQDFYLAEDKMITIYEEVMKHDLLVVVHTGYDIAFERIRRADPKQVLQVHQRFPELKLVTTHLGAWEQWDEVRELIIGKPIYMEISFSIEYLDGELKEMVQSHPEGYVLFGSDSPWTDQGATLERLKNLDMAATLEKALLRENALRLLSSV